ncbi:YaaC family protein [Paraburkholderia lacunae]|uniref:YaaC family protein n=1 Tax=Paraburkholderia lacunae TaxID=2211104 RepID=A0A370NGD8_9BURK|nr:YaaC family protein [Paraburkholderia lacunae]RDK04615.1 hypothetical protein DLM46_01730 [Paraburkholderia lacunae]
MDWHGLQFLESTDNLRSVIQHHHGWHPNAEQARELSACIRQGRLFYETASTAPLEIKPLQLFYGMVAFAKALVLASDRHQRLGTMVGSHGLTDCSAANSRLSDLCVLIRGRGTFSAFNDVVSRLNRLCYFGVGSHPMSIVLPCANSADLDGVRMTLKDILSRTPGLDRIYRATFNTQANAEPLWIQGPSIDGEPWTIRIDDASMFDSRESLRTIVNRWRERFPFLAGWRVSTAQCSWGKSIIVFANAAPNGDDIADDQLEANGAAFQVRGGVPREHLLQDIQHHVDPVGGGFGSGGQYAIAPVNGHFLSEFSLQYAALFVLSSLVRYRPQIWMHSLSQTAAANQPADDGPLALIEALMSQNQRQVPQLVCEIINPGLAATV